MPVDTLPASLDNLTLDDVRACIAAHRLPPVDRWNPPDCGHSSMLIKRDGSWWHEGGEIKRPAMVRMFSSILRREEDGRFVLVTPVEKLEIDVEDTPFLAVELKVDGEGAASQLTFRLNTGELVIADAAHPIGVEERDGAPAPSLLVRPGLEARITRAPFYELAELALAHSESEPGVWSSGCFFPLGSMA